MAGDVPEIVVHAPSNVEVDVGAENVTAPPIGDLGPLPAPPRPGSGITVMLRAPEDVLLASGRGVIARAARSASESDDILHVYFERALAVDAEALQQLTVIGEEEGVSRIHVYVERRG